MHPRANAPTPFEYPFNRLLELRDLVSEEQMRKPDMHDRGGERCLMTIKSGNATGVTIGRANGVFSYVRQYFNNGTHQTSKEWAILSYDKKSGAFSAPGDSGALIADALGRFGGLLTGGSGTTEDLDITYVTPVAWLLQPIKARFPHAHLHPVMAKPATSTGECGGVS